MSELREFYDLIADMGHLEVEVAHAKTKLEETYNRLVPLCPHHKAVDVKSDIRGWGVTRICKICGIEDHASEGGTPGDEYDYGYPGAPSKAFWQDTEVEAVGSGKLEKYRRNHYWRVSDGKAVNKYD